MGKHDYWVGMWTFTHVDKDGNVLFEQTFQNALVNQGEQLLLNTFFRAQDTPSAFYIRLCNDSLSETDVLADILNEPGGNGYAAAEVERSTVGFPSLALDAGDYEVTSKQVSFTASGGAIGPVNTAYLASSSDNSGKLIGYVGLSVERTVLDGDTMYVQFKIKLS